MCDASPEALMAELSAFDRAEYSRIQNGFATADDRIRRSSGRPTFVQDLCVVHRFVLQGNQQDVVRGIICGIEFTPCALLIHTSRLKNLMGRSKSCVNGCFQKLGYEIYRGVHDMESVFSHIFPRFSADSLSGPRKWCIRRLTGMATVCFVPNLRVDILRIGVMATVLGKKRPTTSTKKRPEVEENETIPICESMNIANLLNRKV